MRRDIVAILASVAVGRRMPPGGGSLCAFDAGP